MKKFVSIILCITTLFSLQAPSFAHKSQDIDKIVSDTAAYIYKTADNPQVGSIGGEWAVLGLARSGVEIPGEYYENYYQTAEKYVKDCGGMLHDKKYTEYSRVILALTAIGKNPADVAGYNLLTPLGDYEKTVWQGLNGPVWALIALDSGNYEMPQNPDAKVQATREMYIDRILECQLSDGGWSLFGGTGAASSGDNTSDPDITGMALQALSKYQDNEKVKRATDKALSSVSKKQDGKGGFSSWGSSNSESCVQMLVALCELGISINDSRFVKNGYTILDNLMTYYNDGNGFKHTTDGTDSNLMATEQAFCGLAAVKRMNEGKNSLYQMSDAISVSGEENESAGLKNKSAHIKKKDIVNPGRTFEDIKEHGDKTAIEALASRDIINGKSENSFEPDSTMTRGEFAAIIARGLGLAADAPSVFSDVTEKDWFFSYVQAAYKYGIIKGISETEFNPNGTITREEAAVMIARAASLCGMDTGGEGFEKRDILAEFLDYVTVSEWAQDSLAFCYGEGILSKDVLEIKPKEAVTRAEIAHMLYNMLTLAELL